VSIPDSVLKVLAVATRQPAPKRQRNAGPKKRVVQKNYTGAIVALACWAVLELRRTNRSLTIMDADRTEVVGS
jgi:hypothetical protein